MKNELNSNESIAKQPGRLRSGWIGIKSYFFMWIAGTGLIASTSVCPFCGQAGCPVGFGQAAGLGLFSTVVLAILMKLGIKKPPHTHDHEHLTHPHPHAHSEGACSYDSKITD